MNFLDFWVSLYGTIALILTFASTQMKPYNFGDTLAGALFVLACWCYFRTRKQASSVNLFGSTFYGATPVEGGCVTTLWMVCFMMPILPVRSFLVDESDQRKLDSGIIKFESETCFRGAPLPGLGIYWRHVPETYGKGLLLWIVIIVLTIAGVSCQEMMR